MLIPKILHQTIENVDQLLPEYSANIKNILRMNPDWQHRLYTSIEREDFIRRNFDKRILAAYLSIDPRYGAARADFFRYLVIFQEGGLYLDIKSTALKKLNSVISPIDKFVTAQWPNQINGVDLSDIGIHEDLSFPEYQNWFILASPKSIVIERVIERVMANIKNYRPIKTGVGKIGVLRTTGPIAYSLVVQEFVASEEVRLSTNDDLGFSPTIYPILDNRNPFPNKQNSAHYSELRIPVIKRSTLQSIFVAIFMKFHYKFYQIMRTAGK
jgi:mannosyltransferase OCH1-like enzyme